MRSSPAPVLLIDDNADDLLLTEQLLQKAGIAHPIVTASSGEEAMELLRPPASRLPAFILCDVRMPGMDGFEVLKWIRGQPRFGAVFVAMHTGGDVPADRARAAALGANEFLMKFPTAAELRKIARTADEVAAHPPAPAPG